MPTLTIDKEDLLNLIGKKFSDKKLEEIINLIKPEVERITKKEITYELNPDRPDLFSVEGLARAIKGFVGLETGLPSYDCKKSKLSVEAEKVKVRPYVACAIAKNISLDKRAVRSLMNVQEVLHETLGRNRKKVAIGVHDLDKIRPPIRYVGSDPKAKMVPLDIPKKMSLEKILTKHPKGKKFGDLIKNANKYPTIIDKKGIFSFPPVINSERTRVTDKTKNLFIDITGLDRPAISDVMGTLVTNLADRGATIEKVKIRYPNETLEYPNLKPGEIEIYPKYVNSLLGLGITKKKITEILKKMRYEAKKVKDKFRVMIPPYRSDILHQVDVIEDVAIGYGYDELVPELPEVSTIGEIHRLEKFCDRVRELMIGLGFQETLNPTLTNKEKLLKNLLTEREVVEIANPVSEEYTICRDRILPSLLEFLSKNKHREFPQKIFELESVVVLDKRSETGARNVKRLGAAISDYEVGYSDVRATIDAFLKNFGTNYKIKPTKNPSFIKGRVGSILIESKEVGIIGEINPKVLLNFDLEKPVVGFEINVEKLYAYF